MRIALIGNEYQQQFPLISYGGIEASVEHLAWGLHKARADFFCIVPAREKNHQGELSQNYPFEIVEAPFVPSSRSGRPPVQFAQCAHEILKVKKADIIWSQSHWSVPPLLDLNTPIICTFSDSCPRQEGWMINHPNVFYRFISKFQYRLWVREEWEHSRSFQIYYGLADDEYDFGEEREGYFLWVAGFGWGWQAKGLDVFIKLAKQNQDKRFVAYGTGSQVIEEALKRVAVLLPNFEFKGELRRGPTHREAFKKARAFIMPTRTPETFALTVLESLSKGTPVIGFANGCMPEAVRNHGVISNDIPLLNSALTREFDHRACFEYSKRFAVEHEVKRMLEASERIFHPAAAG